MTTSTASFLTSIMYGAGWILGVALEIAMLIVVLGPVRRHRPRAVPSLLSAVLINMASSLLGLVVPFVTMAVVDRGGAIAQAVIAQGAVSLGLTLVRAVSGVLLLVGLVRLATPDEMAVSS